MNQTHTALDYVLHHPLRFFWRTLVAFREGQGFLLAGGVAYNTLLSIIPLFSILLVVLSHLMEEERLLVIVAANLELILPGQAEAITAQFGTFLAHRELVGWLMVIVLLFFSSLAFTVLENAMSLVFHHRVAVHRRHFLVSAIIPYAYILLLGLGLLLITFISGALQVLDRQTLTLGLWQLELSGIDGVLLYLLGVGGLVLLLTSIYLVMPLGRLSVRHALIGGITATVLWEGVRHVMVWYFSTLSLVNMIYGSLAAAVVALLFLEVGAMILLYGAQVIAEYERLGSMVKRLRS